MREHARGGLQLWRVKAETCTSVNKPNRTSSTCLYQYIHYTYNEGKQHLPQCSRTCSVHNKALQTKDSASICTNVDETSGKPNHNTIVMGDFISQIRKRAYYVETATGNVGSTWKTKEATPWQNGQHQETTNA